MIVDNPPPVGRAEYLKQKERILDKEVEAFSNLLSLLDKGVENVRIDSHSFK